MTELFYRFRIRAYTRAEWEGPRGSDPLLERELGIVLPDPTVEDDHAYRCKLGDGRPWNDTEYLVPGLGLVDLDGVDDGHVPVFNAARRTWETAAAPGQVPTLIAAGRTYTVLADHQVLFRRTIKVDGALVVDGSLIEV